MITHAPQPEDLLPISLATVPLTSTVGVNLYLKTRIGEPPLLFNAAHNPISRTQFEELVQKGSSKLFIHRRDRDLYVQAVKDCWENLLEDDRLPVLQRLAAVLELARDALSEQFCCNQIDEMVQTCQHYGSCGAMVLGGDSVALSDLARLLQHDHSQVTHTLNVYAYTLLMGKQLGFPSTELAQLATGALLHDLGMMDVDPVVLNKPGRLTNCERRQVQAHPALGLQRVIDRHDLPASVMMMIYQHHERLNGTGYPVGIAADEMHPWSRLCAVAEVYAALTSLRPYRQAIVAQTAIAVLERGAGSEFDREMVTCWRRIVLN